MVASSVSTLQQRQEATGALSRCLEDAINRLSAEEIYTHPAHNFKQLGDRLKVKGGCPHHDSKTGSSFVVTISSKLFWCEGCQFGGGPADYRASLKAGRWIKARGRDFGEAVRGLAADANVPLPNRDFSPEEIARAQKWERRRAVLAATQDYCQEALWSNTEAALEARHYLVAERGLTEEEIKLLPIGYYPSVGEVKDHLTSQGFTKDDWKGTGCVWKDTERYITFLWNDSNGRPLTIYGRYFRKYPPEGSPKTIALPGEKTKQSPLYLDRALKAGHKEIVLVEGVLDAVLLQAKGDTRVCAYVAASCSGDQIETLKRRRINKVTLCGDPDHGGERGTNSNLLRLTEAGISVYIAPQLPDELDPDEFLLREGMKGWEAHIDAAEHGFRWKAQRLIESGNVTNDKGKANILQDAIAFCKAVKNHPELDTFFWPVIRSSLGMESEEFRAQLEKLWDSSLTEVAELGGGSGSGGGDDGNKGNVVKFPASSQSSPLDFVKYVLAEKKTKAERNSAFIASGYNVRDLSAIARELEKEEDANEERQEAKDALPRLLQKSSLNPHDYLWGDEGQLAQAIVNTAIAMPTSPSRLMTTLLPVAATLIGTSSRVVVKPSAKYKQPCIIWSGVVGRSGELKSPSQQVIIDALVRLEIDAATQFEQELEDYKIAHAHWKKDKGDPEDEPKLPIRKRYLTEDATLETLERIHGQNPRGVLVYRDELAGDFKAENSHRGGRGADREAKLSQFNGREIIVDRKEREIILQRSAISRTGSIQWEVLQSLMGEHDDSAGVFARWIFDCAESPPRFISFDDEPDTGIDNLLTNLYKRLELMPQADYLLNSEAKEAFLQWQNYLVNRELRESGGLQLVFPKIEAYTARFALWLHVVNAALAGETPAPTIDGCTMSRAIEMAQYYLSQYELIMAVNSPQAGLTGVLLKIFNYLKEKPDGTTIGKLKAGIRSLRGVDKTEIQSHCHWLVENGYAVLDGKKIKSVDTVDKKLTPLSTAEPLIYQGVERKVDKVDKLTNLSNIQTGITEESVSVAPPVVEAVNFVNLSTAPLKHKVKQEVEVVDNKVDNPARAVNFSSECLLSPMPLEQTAPTSADNCGASAVEKPAVAIAPHITGSSNVDEVADSTLGEEAIASSGAEYDELIAKIDTELKRLDWSSQQGKEYIWRTYGKRSRHLMFDDELCDFLQFLESQQ